MRRKDSNPGPGLRLQPAGDAHDEAPPETAEPALDDVLDDAFDDALDDLPEQAQAARTELQRPAAPSAQDNPARRAHAALHRAGAGERERRDAARLLLESYGGRFAGTMRRRLGLPPQDVEEILSDTVHLFITRSPVQCREPEHWLYKVFLRSAISRLRFDHAQRRDPGLPFEPIGSAGDGGPIDLLAADPQRSDPVQILQQRERRAIVMDLVTQVARHSDKRASVMLLAIKGYDRKNIAAALGMSTGAVGDMIYRVHQFVHELMQGDEQ